MKNALLTLSLVIGAYFSCLAQPTTSGFTSALPDTIHIYESNELEEQPRLVDPVLELKTGKNTIAWYHDQYYRHPKKKERQKSVGITYFTFVVDTKGQLSNFKVIRSNTPEMDAKIIRVYKKTSGKWTPGKKNGVAVASVVHVYSNYMTKKK